MPQIVDRLRIALEFAKFSSPDIRDAVNTCIKELAKDMHEVEFEPAIKTIEAFRELDNCITDFENAPAAPIVVVEPDHEVDRETPLVYDISDEIDRITKPAVDDDDDVD